MKRLLGRQLRVVRSAKKVMAKRNTSVPGWKHFGFELSKRERKATERFAALSVVFVTKLVRKTATPAIFSHLKKAFSVYTPILSMYE